MLMYIQEIERIEAEPNGAAETAPTRGYLRLMIWLRGMPRAGMGQDAP